MGSNCNDFPTWAPGFESAWASHQFICKCGANFQEPFSRISILYQRQDDAVLNVNGAIKANSKSQTLTRHPDYVDRKGSKRRRYYTDTDSNYPRSWMHPLASGCHGTGPVTVDASCSLSLRRIQPSNFSSKSPKLNPHPN